MKKSRLFKALICSFLFTGTAISFSSCDNDPKNEPEIPTDKNYFNIVLGVGSDGNDGVYTQAHEDISVGDITFNGYGYEIPADRTARVCASEDGKYLYSLDYGGGTISKFSVNGGQNYTKINMLDVQYAIGTHPRWGKVNDETALLHNVTTTRVYDEAGTEYQYTKAVADLVAINLGEANANLSLGAIQRPEIPRSQEDIDRDLNIWRIDAPVVHNGKVYYGVAKRSYDPATGNNVTVTDYSTTTLIADYPTLTNLKTISSTVCTGENYGYRTPTGNVDEKGDIYQLVGNNRKALMLKITNEEYDNSYVIDLSEKLGFEVGALGWFYVGNGIGYVPYYDLAAGQAEEASAWGIARIDVYNETVIKLNIPAKLWLRQYQEGVLRDGKFYMALAPVGENGAVYIFDPASTSDDGFTTGAVLENLANQFYIGIF